MKIYTEVNYIIKNNNLVKISSKSYDYSGELELCGKGSQSSGNRVTNAITDTLSGITAGDVGEGTLGKVTGKIYGGSTKDIFDTAQGKTGDDNATGDPNPDLTAQEIDPDANLMADAQKRKQDRGRLAANLTEGQTATMLTS